MTDETIQKDVSAQDQKNDQAPDNVTAADQTEGYKEPEKQAPRTDREQKMAAIAEKRKAEREEGRKAAALMADPDLTEESFDAQQVAEREAESASDADDVNRDENGRFASKESDPSNDQVPPAPEGWERRGDGELVRKLKVNGQTVEMTQKEYDRQLSKDLAGDEKLRLAAERERRIAQREEEFARLQKQAASQPPPGADNVDLESAMDEFVGAIYEGDSDAAKQRLKSIMEQGRQSSTPNMDEFLSQASTRVRQEIAEDRRRDSAHKGWSEFKNRYAEIATSSKHLAYTDAVLKEVKEANPDLDPGDQFLMAGEIAYEELGFGKAPEPRTDVSREQRKANLKPVPRAGSTPHQPKREPQMDMSPAGKIARMRAARAR